MSADLASAQAGVASLLAALPPTAWALPTPCPEWDVADVVRHLCVGDRAFTSSLRGTAYDLVPLTADLAATAPSDLPAAYDAGAAELRAALSAGDGPFPTGLGELDADTIDAIRVLEALVHGWDVASASGLPFEVDDAVAERAAPRTLAFTALLPEGRTPFGPAQPVSDDASALDRLLALVGRTPTP